MYEVNTDFMNILVSERQQRIHDLFDNKRLVESLPATQPHAGRQGFISFLMSIIRRLLGQRKRKARS